MLRLLNHFLIKRSAKIESFAQILKTQVHKSQNIWNLVD